MKNAKLHLSKIASFAAFFLSAVLFVNANTASSTLIHQPKAPEGLQRFAKIK